jgi:hypothetical protein
MGKRKKEMLALVVGLSVTVPMRASADDRHQHHNDHHTWYNGRNHYREEHHRVWGSRP